MAVFYSNQVKQGLKRFEKSLSDYPISKERAIHKVQSMKFALYKVVNSPTRYPICRNIDLG